MSCHELLFLDRTGSPCTAPPSAPMPPSAEAALPAHHWWHASSSVAWSHEIFSRTKGDPYIGMRGWLVFLVDDVCKPRIRSVQDPCVYVVWGLVFVVHTPGADKAVGWTSFDSRLPS